MSARVGYGVIMGLLIVANLLLLAHLWRNRDAPARRLTVYGTMPTMTGIIVGPCTPSKRCARDNVRDVIPVLLSYRSMRLILSQIKRATNVIRIVATPRPVRRNAYSLRIPRPCWYTATASLIPLSSSGLIFSNEKL